MRIEDYLYLESDNSCAYCGIRQFENLTEHHIDNNRRNNNYDNLIILCHNCHHRLTNNKGISAKDIKKIKKRLLHKTLTQYGINALKIAYRNKIGVISWIFLVHHLIDMGYMIQKEIIQEYTHGGETISTVARFEITQKGKNLYENWLRMN